MRSVTRVPRKEKLALRRSSAISVRAESAKEGREIGKEEWLNTRCFGGRRRGGGERGRVWAGNYFCKKCSYLSIKEVLACQSEFLGLNSLKIRRKQGAMLMKRCLGRQDRGSGCLCEVPALIKALTCKKGIRTAPVQLVYSGASENYTSGRSVKGVDKSDSSVYAGVCVNCSSQMRCSEAWLWFQVEA